MARYETKFKLEVVRAYDRGLGSRVIARKYDVGRTTLRCWVQLYRQHGIAGLRKKYSHYSVEFKKSVLQRMWRDELSYSEVATLFDIRHQGAIGQWERQYWAAAGFTGPDPIAKRSKADDSEQAPEAG